MSSAVEKLEETDQYDTKDVQNKQDLLPAMGKLSLNVQAVPYIPIQDNLSLVHSSFHAETANEVEYDKNEQITTDKQNGHETEDDLRAQITSLQQDLKQYQDMIGEYHVSEQTRKREVDSALITAREVVERERREKLDVLSDRKSREEQFESLSKTLSVLKAENDEKTRQKDETLAELSRLKTLIQENGFPNVDQFLMLQTQLDTVRQEFFAERKERERIQSQKDKLKRELDAAQSRIASLQEQVYKYREHIYFIQSKFKQPSQFRPISGQEVTNNRPISASEACKLYGPNATQYINHSMTSPMNPISSGTSNTDIKFNNRSEKKAFNVGRQWQDNRAPRSMNDDGWRRNLQQSNRFNNNIHRMTSSNSTPSLVTMATDGSGDIAYYDKQYSKPGFTRKSRSSLTDDTAKDYGLGEWPKMNKQGKCFTSPLPSPTVLNSPGTELWSPQQPPGFQNTWSGGQDDFFRFPPSPLITPTTKSSFETWPNPSTLITDDKVFSPQIPVGANEDNSIFNLPISSSTNSNGESGFVNFPTGPTLSNY